MVASSPRGSKLPGGFGVCFGGCEEWKLPMALRGQLQKITASLNKSIGSTVFAKDVKMKLHLD